MQSVSVTTLCFVVLVVLLATVSYGTVTVGRASLLFDDVIRYGQLRWNPDAVESTTLLFVGDVMLARDVERHIVSHGLDYPYVGVHHLFTDSTAVIANFEAAIPSAHHPTPDFTFQFSVRPDIAAAARGAGITHWSLANNHTFDYGAAGYAHTIKSLNEAGFTVFGHPREVSLDAIHYLNLSDQSVALIGLNVVGNKMTKSNWREIIAHASRQSDQQIIYIHWGTEYELTRSDEQERVAGELIAAGADLIIGHHPHVVQDIQYVEGVPVIYSLGNFIFDQYFSDEVQVGLVLRVGLKASAWELEFIPVSSRDSRVQPHLMPYDEARVWLQNLAARSDQGLRAGISTGLVTAPFRRSALE